MYFTLKNVHRRHANCLQWDRTGQNGTQLVRAEWNGHTIEFQWDWKGTEMAAQAMSTCNEVHIRLLYNRFNSHLANTALQKFTDRLKTFIWIKSLCSDIAKRSITLGKSDCCAEHTLPCLFLKPHQIKPITLISEIGIYPPAGLEKAMLPLDIGETAIAFVVKSFPPAWLHKTWTTSQSFSELCLCRCLKKEQRGFRVGGNHVRVWEKRRGEAELQVTLPHTCFAAEMLCTSRTVA